MSIYKMQQLYPAEVNILIELGMQKQRERDAKARRKAWVKAMEPTHPDDYDWHP